MAQTSFNTNNASTRKVWSEKVMREAYDRSIFAQLNSVKVLEEHVLTGGSGDTINVPVRATVTGTPLGENDTLEGNARSMTFTNNQILLVEQKDAVQVKSGISKLRTAFEQDSEMLDVISSKVADDLDQDLFDALILTDPSNSYYSDAGTIKHTATYATARAAITASDTIGVKIIRAMKVAAMTGRDNARSKIAKLDMPGVDYILLMPSEVAEYDLKNNSEYAQAIREAHVRGENNPFFKGSIALLDGVLIISHEKVRTFTNAGPGSDVAGGDMYLMGKQALLTAWGMKPDVWKVEDDWKDFSAMAYKYIYGTLKTQDTGSKDLGIITGVVARAGLI